MDQQEYLITFYSIVVGLTATKYLQGWGDLLKDRATSRDVWLTLLWSASMFLALLNVWLVEYSRWDSLFSIPRLVSALLEPFGLYLAGVLLFPREVGAEGVEDYHAHFMRQKSAIMVVLLFLLLIKWEPLDDALAYTRTRAQLVFLAVPILATLFTERRPVLLISAASVLLFWLGYAAGYV